MRTPLIAVVLCCALGGCSHFPCDAERVSDTSSPNGQLTATIVQIGCGAMAKDATWVTVHRAGEKYDRPDEAVFIASEQRQVEVSWSDDKHLSLFCRCSDQDIRRQVVKIGDINISYK